MFAQMSNLLENFLSMQQCGFQKGYRMQLCALVLLEKWKCAIDRGKTFGALLTNLPKTFDCLDHQLLIAKLNAHGFVLPALKLVHHSLSQRKKRSKANHAYSIWLDIILVHHKAQYLNHYII